MDSFDRRSFLRLAASATLLPPLLQTSLLQTAPNGPEALSAGDDFDPQPYLDAIQHRVKTVRKGIAEGPYTTDVASLKKVNEAPEWWRDAKFGIYFHFGVYSVPAFASEDTIGEWYPHFMYETGSPAYEHHVETYGSPADYPYTRFVPQFDAAQFDADRWAELFEQAGARYAGPVAEHHDGFAMWDSQLTPWNAAAMGPKRDVVGEMAEALRKRGMRLITPLHHERNHIQWRQGEWAGHYAGVKKNFPALLDDPKAAWMYGDMPRKPFLNMWLAKMGEVIDEYQPDLMYLDSWLDEVPIYLRKQFLAYLFNTAEKKGKEVVVTHKQGDLPIEASVKNIEKGRYPDVQERPFQTSETISKGGTWGYAQGMELKPTARILHALIDIVSKNGCLQLNVCPRANGTIPEDQQAVLLSIGEWLDQNGEAIYSTRPWATYGEGPTELKEGKFGGVTDAAGGYTARDVRYTRSKDGGALYVIALGWPEGKLTLRSVAANNPSGRTVQLLGYEGGRLRSSINDRGQLVIDVPDLAAQERPGKYAYVFKLTGFDPTLHRSRR